MTITLNAHQEEAIQEAIRVGRVGSVEEFIERAFAELALGVPEDDSGVPVSFQQGLGLFGSPEDSALLDDVVALAYEERRHPGAEPALPA